MVGRSVDELLGMPPGTLSELTHPEDRSSPVADYWALEGPAPGGPVTFRVLRTDGGVRWLEGRVRPLEWGGVPAVQGDFIDVTEQVGARFLTKHRRRDGGMVDLDVRITVLPRDEGHHVRRFVTVETTVDVGTTFHVHLPATPADQAVHDAGATSAPPAKGERERTPRP